MTRPRKLILSAVALLPVVLCLGWAAIDLPSAPPHDIACRVLPNRLVPLVNAGETDCPLRPYDRIVMVGDGKRGAYVDGLADLRRAATAGGDAIRVLVARGGSEQWVRIPVVRESGWRRVGRLASAILVAAVLLTPSLLILWRSNALAAVPLLLLCTCVSMVLIASLCGHYSDGLAMPGVLAGGFVPAAIGHLALTFPREREIVRRTPEVSRMLYALSGVLALIATINFHRSPAVWALTDRALLGFSAVAWGLLVIACVLAVRESNSTLERTRARVLLVGTVAVPLVPIAIGLLIESAIPGGSLALLTLTVALFPLPISYAIARYRLFDLQLNTRKFIAYVLYGVATAAVVCAAAVLAEIALGIPMPLGDAGLLFAVILGALLATDGLRARSWRAIEGWVSPWLEHLSELRDQHARWMAQLRDEDECARYLCDTAQTGLDARGIAVFLSADGGWRLAHAAGSDAPIPLAMAALAATATSANPLLYLAEEESLDAPEHDALRGLGVEVVAAIRSGGERLGLLLATASRKRRPYGSRHIEFLRTVIAQSAVAIHNARIARELLAAERFATLGRARAGLVHDLGKPFGVIERLAEKLPSRLRDRERARRDAQTIAALALEIRSSMRGLLEGADGAALRGRGDRSVSVEEVIDAAVRMVSRVHGERRIALRLAPELPALEGIDEKCTRILANVLDNAFLASAPGDVVEVAAAAADGELRLEVLDHGCGMSAEVAERAFEPFFTTRRAGEGSGLGLAIDRELVEGLGGRIDLESTPGRGTRVRISLPVAKRKSRRAE